MSHRKSLMIAALLAATTSIAFGAIAEAPVSPAPKAAKAEKAEDKPIFLSPDLLKPAQILPTPPKDGSAEGVAELNEIRSITAARTPDALTKAEKDGDTENVSFFADTIPGFDPAKLPATAKLFNDVRNDEDYEAKVFKTYFHRNRPYQVDASIATCHNESGKKPASYPSGHATMSYSMGLILADLIPEKADAILSRVKVYTYNRLVCGVHYRSDIVAGQELGSIVAVQLLQNPAFRKELEASRAELKAAKLAN